MALSKELLPTVDEIHHDVMAIFNVNPCLFQIHDAVSQLRGEDCITIAPTGSEKTLTFWIPLLYNQNQCIILIIVLNILGDQNVKELEIYGFKAINLTAQNRYDSVFKVPHHPNSFHPSILLILSTRTL